MKLPARLLIVSALAFVVLLGGAILLFLPANRPVVTAPAPDTKASPVQTAQTSNASPAQVQDLERKLADERSAREKAEATASELRNRLAPLEDNVVVSFGKIEDVGHHTAALLTDARELRELSARDPASLSADEKHRLLDLQREQADVLGMLPEIAGFQDNPKEYGRFFRSMLQPAAKLSDSQAAQVESYMQQRGQAMVAQGLNAAVKPADPAQADAWETQRDQFNQQSASGLAALLPPGAAARAGFSDHLLEFLEMDFPADKPGQPADP